MIEAVTAALPRYLGFKITLKKYALKLNSGWVQNIFYVS